MKFIKKLPFESAYEKDDPIDCIVFESKENICEFNDPLNVTQFDSLGDCDNSGYYYGTSDEREPKFCARHFYQNVVNGEKGGGSILRSPENRPYDNE